ncbi:hypothetical protein BT69DRAFT_1275799, partial [Atractiella rhizophila]
MTHADVKGKGKATGGAAPAPVPVNRTASAAILYFADSQGEGSNRLGYDAVAFQKAYERIVSYTKEPLPVTGKTKSEWKGELKKEDIELIKKELEIEPKEAEELLKVAEGNVVAALLSGTSPHSVP